MEKQKHKPIAPEAFVKAWQTSKSIDEVIKATGMRNITAQARARMYRKKGIKLQKFARRPSTGAPPLDVAKLSKLAASFTKPVKPVKKSTKSKKKTK